MTTECINALVVHPVALDAGLAVLFALLAQGIKKAWLSSNASQCSMFLRPAFTAVLWALAVIFGVTAWIEYLISPYSGSATGNSASEMNDAVMSFVGAAFAMFTGIAVLMLSDARKELGDGLKKIEEARSEWSRLPSYLALSRTSAIATTSARYANAIANRALTQRGAAIDVIVCAEVLKVIAELDGRNVKKRGDAGVGELKNIHENRRFFTRLCDPEWEQVWVYLNALHDSLVDAKLGDTEAARELGEVLHDLQDSARGGDDA